MKIRLARTDVLSQILMGETKFTFGLSCMVSNRAEGFLQILLFNVDAVFERFKAARISACTQ